MRLSTISTLKHLNSSSERVITLDQDELHRLQQVLLSIAEDIIDVCEREHISYHLTGGSALGAVRHKGFIPWDDDLDIDILGSDFDRFEKTFIRKYGDRYWLETYQTPGFGNTRYRVRQKGSVCRATEDVNAKECGIFVDLIRIENTFDFAPYRWLHGAFCMGFGFLLSCRNFYQNRDLLLELVRNDRENTRIFRIKIDIGRFLSFLSLETWAGITQRCYGLCKNNHSKYVTVPAGIKHYFGEMRLRKDFVQTVDAEFEGHIWKIPKDYDGYLKGMYGNYMEIPKEADREKHVFLELKFKDGKSGEEEKYGSERSEDETRQPVISVIMPVYNMAACLRGSVSSVLRQTFSSFELILVNDGSDDGSLKICRAACKKDRRVRLISCPENRGVSHARNLGIEAAKGKYLCFQDADDLMHPQLLECMWREALKIRADVVMTDHWLSERLSRKTWRRLCRRPVDPDWEIWKGEQGWNSWCVSGLGGTVWAKLFSREAVGELRFCEDIDRSEDWLFNYQFLTGKSRLIAVTYFRGYYHIQNPDSLNGKATVEEFLSGIKVKRFIRDRELQASREENALFIEQRIIVWIRNWLSVNPKAESEDRSVLVKAICDSKGNSPLFEKLPLQHKLLLLLSMRASPVFRGLKSGKLKMQRFLNSFYP